MQSVGRLPSGMWPIQPARSCGAKRKAPSPLLQANPTSLPAMPGSSRRVPGRHVAGMGVGTTARCLLRGRSSPCLLPARLGSLPAGGRARGRAAGTVVQAGQGKHPSPRAGVTWVTSPRARCHESGSRNGRVGPPWVLGACRPAPGCWGRRRRLRFAGLGGDRKTPSEGFARNRTIIPLLGPTPSNKARHKALLGLARCAPRVDRST